MQAKDLEGTKRAQVSSPACSCLRHGPLTVENWCVQMKNFAPATGVVMSYTESVRCPEGELLAKRQRMGRCDSHTSCCKDGEGVFVRRIPFMKEGCPM